MPKCSFNKALKSTAVKRVCNEDSSVKKIDDIEKVRFLERKRVF
ncbi:Uncharacterised protein [Enterococcus durans]|uniref:Uncharacterized protein n=1 Tax=Enterococcus durans TaxID=53345 RepID=A0A377KGB3_9ENTE|nr:Uncharacterised protein [Enterococcus durans]